ncbi:hypothetical protein IWQ57_001805 [Coemansia nantahalensis]|uniref:Uncharacterized protein n=1 Tax=Coemansia nantahalensis TaxID=2789366 RepID=A0ACC1K2W6_9FUNG|nr:hypothetical protein IWQ57_001805 [Coemansia nantahalensis]
MEQQQQQPLPGDGDDLPTYEETVETAPSKRYTLRHPQLASPAVHAVDTDTGDVAYSTYVRGVVPPQTEFHAGDRRGARPLWRCTRERDGLELVFSRQVELLPPPPPLSASGLFGQQQQLNGADQVDNDAPAAPAPEGDGLATDSAANLYDNKPAADDREYIHQENDDAPPAYEESDGGAELVVRLTSVELLPFAFDFVMPEGRSGTEACGAEGPGQLRWLRSQEAKNPDAISPGHPWTAFMCVERTTGRLLARVVYYSEHEHDQLGTLLIHGDPAPEEHEFLVVSAIAVVEEYTLRGLAD